jgi:transcriptional regulator with XRE-family HTH domain
MPLVTGPQLRAARAMAGLDQLDLASTAGVSANTIRKLEAEPGEFRAAKVATVRALERELERAGIELIADRDTVGVQMRRPKP